MKFDIAVIGAGIHGAAIAWDATLRGFSVVLIDKKDIGSGATAGNYRIIHGGLRYLQHFDLIRLFESAREQQIFRRIAPEALDPLPFLIPCYGFGMRGREILECGVSLYDTLTFGRNTGVQERLKLPWHKSLNKAEILEVAPYLEQKQLRGGIIYYDAQMRDPDRLTQSFAISAAKKGCEVKTYTEVVGAELLNGEIQEIVCLDRLENTTYTIKAKLVINAAGAWREATANKILGKTSESNFVFSKGLQITLPELTKVGVALESKFKDSAAFVSKGNRSYFLQPWRNLTIAGTADIIHTTEPDTYKLNDAEVETFVSELAALYPDPKLNKNNVKFAFGGLRPVTPEARERFLRGELPTYGSIEVAHRDTIVNHSQESAPTKNLISVEGIKYTTTRKLAETVVNLAEELISEKRRSSQTATTPLDYRENAAKVDDTALKDIIKNEFVRTSDDLLERRLGYGGVCNPGVDEVDRVRRIFSEREI